MRLKVCKIYGSKQKTKTKRFCLNYKIFFLYFFKKIHKQEGHHQYHYHSFTVFNFQFKIFKKIIIIFV